MIPLEDGLFVACALVGLVLLVPAVFPEQLSGVLEAVHVEIDVGRLSIAPRLLGFALLFGAGGLVARHVLAVDPAAAALAGAVAGGVGAIAVPALVRLRRVPDDPGLFPMRDLVGREASVAVAIPAGRFGSIYVRTRGDMQEYSATAATDIAAGTRVAITAALGNGLIVAEIEPEATESLL